MTTNTVVFISDIPNPREFKFASGLKEIGWNVILMHRSPAIFSNFQPFSKVLPFTSINDLIPKILEISPEILHVFIYYDYSFAYHLINTFKTIPVIIDPFDVIYGMFKHEFFIKNPLLTANSELEKYCFSNADGICCRCLQTQVYRREIGFNKNKRILFFDGCLPGIKKNKVIVTNNNDVHLVYAGAFCAEKLFPEFKGFGGFLWVAKKIIEANMHFHLYPSSRNFNVTNFADDYSEYYELEKNSNGKFHFHRPIPYENLISELSQYDAGIYVSFPEKTENIDEVIYCERSQKSANYVIPNKIFDSLEAGLPVIADPVHHKCIMPYLKKLKVFISPDELIYSEKPSFDLEKLNIANQHIAEAAEYFN
ncbi:MAG: hypothetical protein AB1349_14390, partial [Elusimicrobiota bacterium]